MAQKVLLKKSSVVNKVPSANKLDFGELAINYASGVGQSFLATKKYDGTVAQFHEDAYNDNKFATNSKVDVIESSLGNFALSATVRDQISAITTTVENNQNTTEQAFNVVNERLDAIEGITSGLSGNYLTIDSADTAFSNLEARADSAYTRAEQAYKHASAVSATLRTEYWTSATTSGRITTAVSKAIFSAFSASVLSAKSYTDTEVATATAKADSARTIADNAYRHASAVSATLRSEYWTSATTKDKIASASAAAVTAANNYADNNFLTKDSAATMYDTLDAKIVLLSGGTVSAIEDITDIIEENEAVTSAALADLNARLSGVSTTINNLSGSYLTVDSAETTFNNIGARIDSAFTGIDRAYKHASAVSATLRTEYWTSATTKDKIASASAAAVTEAFNQAVASANLFTTNQINPLTQKFEGVSGQVWNLSGAVKTTLSTVYKYKGTKNTYSQLPTGSENGDVWNVVSGNGTTPPGTNYAWVANSAETGGGHWDPLGGSVDLSAYFKSDSAVTMVNTLTAKIDSAYTRGDNAYKHASAVSATLRSEYWTSATTSGRITTAVSKGIFSAFSASVLSAKSYTDNKVETAESHITQLSGSVTAFSATVVNTYATETQAGDFAAAALANSMAYTDSKISGLSIGDYLTVDSAASAFATIGARIDSAYTRGDNAYKHASAVSATLRSEYWTSGETNNKINAAKSAAIFSAFSASVLSAKSYTDTQVSTATAKADSAYTRAEQAYSHASAVSAALRTEYWTSATTKDKIAEAKSAAIFSGFSASVLSAKSYTDTEVATARAKADSAYTRAEQAYKHASAVSATLRTEYWTSGTTNTKINDAKSTAIFSGFSASVLSAKSYTDTKFETAEAKATSAYTRANEAYNLASSVNTTLRSEYWTSATTKDKIAEAKSTAIFSGFSASVLSAKSYTDTKFSTATAKADSAWTYANSAYTRAEQAYKHASAVSATLRTEYWTSGTTRDKINAASANAVTSAITYVGNNYLTKTSAGTMYDGLDSRITGVSGKVNELSASVIANYATEAMASTYAAAALADSMDYTDSKISSLSIGDYLTVASATSMYNTLNAKADSAWTRGDNAYKQSSAVSASLRTEYWTSGTTNTKINAASANAVTSAITYAGNNYLTKTSAGTMYDGLDARITGVSGKTHGLSGQVWNLSGAVQDKLTNVYKYQGSVANVGALPNSGKVNGYVYNVVAASGTPGTEGYVPAGTNYAWNGNAWDPLGGTVDLTGYFTVASATTMVQTLDGKIDTVSSHTFDIYNIIEEDEEVTASALNDLQTKYDNLNGLVGGLSSIYATADSLGAVSAAAVNSAVSYFDSSIVNYVTTADTGFIKFYDCTLPGNPTSANITSAIPLDFTEQIDNDIANGVLPILRLSFNGCTLELPFGCYTPADEHYTFNTHGGFGYTVYSFDCYKDDPGNNVFTSKMLAARDHTHADYATKTELGPVSAAAVNSAVTYVSTNYVPKTRKVNGYALSADVTITKSDLGLGNVENTKLSTWTGNTSIASVGTITAGTWNGGKIANKYLTNSAVTIDGQVVGLGTSATTKNVAQSVSTATTFRPLLLGNTSNATPGNLSAATTGQTYLTTKAYVKPSTGEIHAGGYIIDGKAATDLLNATGGVTSISTVITNMKDLKIYKNGASVTAYNGTAVVSALTTDANVSQSNTTTDKFRPLTLGFTSAATADSLSSATTNKIYVTSKIYAKPSTGMIYANGFNYPGKAATDLLNATGGVTTVASIRSGYVPETRKVNGYPLSADVTITKSDLSLGNVENTKLSTWTGNTSIASVGTITAGTWNGTKIANNYLANSSITINGTTVGLGGTITLNTDDEKVKQENVTTADYRPLLLGANSNAAVGSIPTTTVTGTSYMNKSIYAQPSTGELGATQMKVGGHVTLQYNSTTESLDFIFS